MIPTTLNGNTFQLLNSSNTALGASISYNSSTFTATLQPSSPLAVSSTYTVVLHGGTRRSAGQGHFRNSVSRECDLGIYHLFDCLAGLSLQYLEPVERSCGRQIRETCTPVEVGVRFRSDVSGLITGVRFYKSAANTGVHKANLWSNTGTLLASATAVKRVEFRMAAGDFQFAGRNHSWNHLCRLIFCAIGSLRRLIRQYSTLPELTMLRFTLWRRELTEVMAFTPTAGASAFPASTFNGTQLLGGCCLRLE